MSAKSSRREYSPRKVLLKVYTRFEERNLIASVVVAAEAHLAQGATVELRLIQTGEEVLQRRTIRRLLPGARREAVFPLDGIKSGCCRIRATLTDRHGRTLEAHVLQEKTPPPTDWLGSAEGITRKVPAPWTPLKTRKTASGFAVESWGRTYEFGRRSLVRRVQSRDRTLLSAPIRLVGEADGRRISWTAGTIQCITRGNDEVLLLQNLSGGNLALSVRTQVDFDGMARFDCRLSARKATLLDRLTLEIPLRAEHARYLCQFPSRWWVAGENPQALPRKGMTLGFHPFFWLGDEERGLAWFCESDVNWFHGNPQRAVRIVRKGGAVILQLHLVARPVTLGEPAHGKSTMTIFGAAGKAAAANELSYTFGLQATPVKPVEKDAWDHRIFCLGIEAASETETVPLQISTSTLDKVAAAGVRTVVIFEYWTDVEAHAKTAHGRKLKGLVRACHARGLKVLLYFGFLISDIAPEWPAFGKECVVTPMSGYPVFHYRPQPEQSAWKVCLRSVWQDFVAAGIGGAMDTFDVDGVYLDGTEYPFGCCNTLHGCGAQRADGSIAPTYPIFAARSAMRRIYNAVRSRKPDGQINVHNSRCVTIPSLGWATSYWDGEQFQSLTNGSKMKDLLPLDAFRAEFMGHQWGVPAAFLCYGNALTYQQAWAVTLLHDVPVRPFRLEPDMALIASIWRVMDDFGRKEAEWLPYWRNSEHVKASPKGIYVTLYRHPRNGVLAVVSNLSGRKLSGEVRMNLSRLRLAQEHATAHDAITNDSMEMTNGRIKCSLASFDWKLIRIKT